MANGTIHLAFIGVGNELVEVVLSDKDVQELYVGDSVLVKAKAFNPIVVKLLDYRQSRWLCRFLSIHYVMATRSLP
jgi:ASC-1-like (ASCH) protein